MRGLIAIAGELAVGKVKLGHLEDGSTRGVEQVRLQVSILLMHEVEEECTASADDYIRMMAL